MQCTKGMGVMDAAFLLSPAASLPLSATTTKVCPYSKSSADFLGHPTTRWETEIEVHHVGKELTRETGRKEEGGKGRESGGENTRARAVNPALLSGTQPPLQAIRWIQLDEASPVCWWDFQEGAARGLGL
jgi:hypothetical protein